jgi:hypothetical protein
MTLKQPEPYKRIIKYMQFDRSRFVSFTFVSFDHMFPIIVKTQRSAWEGGTISAPIVGEERPRLEEVGQYISHVPLP